MPAVSEEAPPNPLLGDDAVIPFTRRSSRRREGVREAPSGS